VAGLVLLGAGFLLGRMSAPEGEPRTEVSGDRTPAPTPAATTPSLDSRPVEERHAAPAETVQRIREIVDEMPIPEIPTGAGVIDGRVRSADGRPLAGVDITLVPVAPRRSSPVSAQDPAEVLAQTAVRQNWTRAATRTATTGEEGAFRFEAVADVEHDIHARRDGQRIARSERGAGRVRPGQTVEFTATAVVEVDVDVRLPDGRPAEQATIRFKADSTSSSHGWTSGDRVLSLDPGRYQVWATGGPDNALGSKATSVTLESGRRTTLRFDLGSVPSLLVRVRYPDGEEGARARVAVARVPVGGRADPALLATPVEERDLHGATAVISEIVSGRYVVGAQRARQGPFVVIAEVTVGESAATVELQIPPLRRDEYAQLRVLGPGGEPIPNPQITIGFQSESSSSSIGGPPTIRRPDGAFWVLTGALGEVPADARRWIHVAAGTLGSRRVEFGPTEALDIVIRLEDPVALAVEVHGVLEGHVGRVHVRLLEGEKGYHGLSAAVGSDGKVTLEGVQPGKKWLVLLIQSGDETIEIARRELDVVRAGNPVVVEMPALHSVTFVGAESGLLSVMREEPNRSHFTMLRIPAGSGRVTLDTLPAGDYLAHCGARQAKFSVPGPAEVVLR
jgi:hypothetical protein